MAAATPTLKKKLTEEAESIPTQPSTKKRPKFMYSEESMESALKAVQEGRMSSRKASREFAVPFSTLQYKVKGKTPEGRRMGPATVLSPQEELLLERYIVANAKKGFPLNKRTLVETVQNIVTEDKRANPFTNNRPGYSWITSFLKRHPGLTQRHAEVINRGRAQVTEEKLRGWGKNLLAFLKEEKADDILEDPSRIFNLDESGFRTNPESGLVLGPVNYQNFYVVKDGSEKENITTLVTVNAAGDMLPPMVVFPYVRIPMEIARNPKWALGRSPSGWMTGQTFFCFIGNTFIPWLKSNNIKLPVLLLIDGHKSHLTLNVCRLCKANSIILYALLPNATHIIQPLDVSVFRALKAGWKNVVEDWKRNSTENRVLTRSKFPKLFETALNERATPQVIKNGFRKCGLFPFNLDNIDFTKCMSHESRTSVTGEKSNFIPAKPGDFGIPQLLFVKSCMGRGRAEQFREKEKTGWDGEESATELFELWKKLRKKCIVDIETGNLVKGNIEEGQKISNTKDQVEQVTIEEIQGVQNAARGDSDEEDHQNIHGKIVITPQKIPLCKPTNISPAFLGNIVWPTESPQKKNAKNVRKQKERLPHAATSKKWLTYWENIEEEKKKEEDKQMKKLAKEEKKNASRPKDNTTKKKVVTKQKMDQPSTSRYQDDWFCPKCKGSYNMDKAMCNGRKWIGPCNDCESWYHKNCVSKKIVCEFGLNDISDDEESDFVCDLCFGVSDDELDILCSESDGE